MRPLPFQFRQATVAADGVNPGRERCFAMKIRQRFPNPEENLLRHIVGLRFIAQDAEREMEDFLFVALNQMFESRMILPGANLLAYVIVSRLAQFRIHKPGRGPLPRSRLADPASLYRKCPRIVSNPGPRRIFEGAPDL